MCIIVDATKNPKPIDEDIIDECFRINQHGSAIYILDDDELHKSLDNKKMLALAKKVNKSGKKWIMHCRFKTQGKVCLENVHMFEEGDYLIAMNGTIGGLADKDKNDTLQAIQMMKLVKPSKVKKFLEFYEARFLVINRKTKKIIKTGKWIEDDGASYSKDNVLNFYYYGHNTQTYGGYYQSKSTTSKSKTWNPSQSYTNWAEKDKELSTKNDEYYAETWVNHNGVMVPASKVPVKKEDNRVFGFAKEEPSATGDTMLVGTYGMLDEFFEKPTEGQTFVENVLTKDKFVYDDFEGISYIQRGKYENSDHQQLSIYEMEGECVDWIDTTFKTSPECVGSVEHLVEKQLVRVVGDKDEYNVWVYFLTSAVAGGVQ